MKVPLTYQVTKYDCGPASVINAFSFLLNREEFTPKMLKVIFQYTLDCCDEMKNDGTSKNAIRQLLNAIRKVNCNIKYKILNNDDITLDSLKAWLNNKGIVLIRCWQLCEHYAIITKIDDNYAHIFDPYYLSNDYYKNDNSIDIVENMPFNYNRRVTLERIFEVSKKDFSLGQINRRECILINKCMD